MRVEVSEYIHEIVTRMEQQGSFDREAYYDMVEEVLEEKRQQGLLTDDDDIEEMEDQLRKRWPEAEAMFVSGHDEDVLQESEE